MMEGRGSWASQYMRGWAGLQNLYPVSLTLESAKSGHQAQMWEVGQGTEGNNQSKVMFKFKPNL